MNKKVWLILLILTIIVIIVAVTVGILKENSENITNSKNKININNSVNENILENKDTVNNDINEYKESGEMMNTTIRVNIDNEIYTATLEQNETAKQFIDMLPQEFNMNELNGNEKYVYLDTILHTNSYSTRHIESGDIMLYGNNCLVIFYKSFDTSYSYTKIGHINDLKDIENNNIVVKFEI